MSTTALKSAEVSQTRFTQMRAQQSLALKNETFEITKGFVKPWGRLMKLNRPYLIVDYSEGYTAAGASNFQVSLVSTRVTPVLELYDAFYRGVERVSTLYAKDLYLTLGLEERAFNANTAPFPAWTMGIIKTTRYNKKVVLDEFWHALLAGRK